MERLTKVMNCNDGNKLYDFSNEIVSECKEHSERVKLAVKKLAAYEDAEEQGLLFRLPCKVEDIIWDNDFGEPHSYVVTGFDIGTTQDEDEDHEEIHMYYNNGWVSGCIAILEIGKSVFLTREEAEQALKDMESEG